MRIYDTTFWVKPSPILREFEYQCGPKSSVDFVQSLYEQDIYSQVDSN